MPKKCNFCKKMGFFDIVKPLYLHLLSVYRPQSVLSDHCHGFSVPHRRHQDLIIILKCGQHTPHQHCAQRRRLQRALLSSTFTASSTSTALLRLKHHEMTADKCCCCTILGGNVQDGRSCSCWKAEKWLKRPFKYKKKDQTVVFNVESVRNHQED